MFATKPETTITPLLLTAKEAARSLSVSERTLWAMTQAGEMPVVATIGVSIPAQEPEQASQMAIEGHPSAPVTEIVALRASCEFCEFWKRPPAWRRALHHPLSSGPCQSANAGPPHQPLSRPIPTVDPENADSAKRAHRIRHS